MPVSRYLVVAVGLALALSVSEHSIASSKQKEKASIPEARPWPGSPTRGGGTAAPGSSLGPNISGLVFVGPTTLWAVRDTGSLLKLVRSESGWAESASWESGRPLLYPDGSDGPDAEAVTTAVSDDGAIYVGTERSNGDLGTSRNSILRYDISSPGTSGSPLVASAEWHLDSIVGVTSPNGGIEGLTWISDDVLVRTGLLAGNSRYVPSAYAKHGGGLFVVGMEKVGTLFLVALQGDGKVSLVATIPTGLSGTMDLTWVPSRGELWAICDSACDGRSAVFTIGNSIKQAPYVRPPAGMESLNLEGLGFATSCSGKNQLVVWSDDNATDGQSLREGTIACKSTKR
jgi:hypothetical protein